jgi:hypothetical protein
MDPDEAIYEAATFAKVPKWPLLRAFLLKKGVELTVLNTKSSKDWMDELSAAREELNAMIVEVEDAKLKKQRAGSDKVEERERSMVSRRDSRESSDSGYHTAPFKDLVCCASSKHDFVS